MVNEWTGKKSGGESNLQGDRGKLVDNVQEQELQGRTERGTEEENTSVPCVIGPDAR